MAVRRGGTAFGGHSMLVTRFRKNTNEIIPIQSYVHVGSGCHSCNCMRLARRSRQSGGGGLGCSCCLGCSDGRGIRIRCPIMTSIALLRERSRLPLGRRCPRNFAVLPNQNTERMCESS